MDDGADTAPAAETPRAPRHRGRGALPRAAAVRGSLEIVLGMLQLEDVAGATLLLKRPRGCACGCCDIRPRAYTTQPPHSGAAARPHDPATEPGESGVALGVGTTSGGGAHACMGACMGAERLAHAPRAALIYYLTTTVQPAAAALGRVRLAWRCGGPGMHGGGATSTCPPRRFSAIWQRPFSQLLRRWAE